MTNPAPTSPDPLPPEAEMGEEEAAGLAEETAAPLPKDRRNGTALCLSGGGYRAALFHLGALRRLNELGVLSQVTTFSSVSGGSIVNAHIVAALATDKLTWPDKGEVIDNWDAAVTQPVVGFCRRNIRTPAILNRLRPDHWFQESAGAEGLEAQYRKKLTDLTLGQLPRRPRFVFSATDTAFGVNWKFDCGDRQAGDYQAGYTDAHLDWPLARAVAASSCFPPVFNPLPAKIDPDQLSRGRYRKADRDDLISSIGLSDGGVYDNMGLEPVWKTRRTVLVSDGGAPFTAQRDRGIIWRIQRYAAIQGNQAAAVRRRWLIDSYERPDSFDGTYWGISSSPESYPGDHPGYSKNLAAEHIAEIRTDLDRFSPAEATILQTHGYYLANAATHTWTSHLIRNRQDPTLPAPQPGDETRVIEALAGSSKTNLIGRGAFTR